MVFLPSRISDQDIHGDESFNRSARIIFDILDIVGNVRDGDHLQCIAYLAQELGLLADEQPCFLFGSQGDDIRHPHSLLLESHLYILLRDGYVDIDNQGRLRLRRDVFDIPYSGLVCRNLSAISTLTPQETALFASVVLRLSQEGRHAGSYRHDQAFSDMLNYLRPLNDPEYDVDATAICAARRRLLLSEPSLLTTV